MLEHLNFLKKNYWKNELSMKTAILFVLFLGLINVYSQEFGLGLLLDDSLYANSPTAAPLMRGDYSDLPPSASLKKECTDSWKSRSLRNMCRMVNCLCRKNNIRSDQK